MSQAANMQKVMIFVDEANYARTARDSGRNPDFFKLKDFLANQDDGRDLVEMVVYLGFPPNRKEEEMSQSWRNVRNKKTKLRDALEYKGIIVVSKEGKSDSSWTYPNGDIGYSANVDTLMAIDALEFAVEARPDIVVLVTGDGDFSYLAQKIRRRGIRVEAASKADKISGQLKKAVNNTIDLVPFFNTLDGIKIGDADSFIDGNL